MRQRVMTGVIGGAVFLLLLFLGGIAYTLFLFVVAALAFREWAALKEIPQVSLLYVLSLLVLLVSIILGPRLMGANLQYWGLLALFFLSIPVFTKNQTSVTDIAHLFIGLLYIGLGLSAMFSLRQMADGLTLSLFIVLGTWMNDSLAYLYGKRYGKRKLWPSISPNKTVEGSLAGFAGTLFISLCFSFFLDMPAYQLGGLGLLVALFGQLGDLVESAVKRSFAVKDSGQLLPGHGGVLDRFDSLLFAFPIISYLFFLVP